jgi:hypothetical protein
MLSGVVVAGNWETEWRRPVWRQGCLGVGLSYFQVSRRRRFGLMVALVCGRFRCHPRNGAAAMGTTTPELVQRQWWELPPGTGVQRRWWSCHHLKLLGQL